MAALNPIQAPLHSPAQETDPFLRKNQTWFHQPLPPSIDRVLHINKKPLSDNHTRSITARILDPYPVERRRLVPRSHAQQLKNLQEKIYALSNQMPETEKLAGMIQNEITLAQDFYSKRILATPC